MPSYEYRCPECGIVEKFYPMGAAPSAEACSDCGNVAKRLFSPPLLGRTPRRLASALEQADKSRDEPAVVRRDDNRPRRDIRNPVDPALQKLVGKQAARDLKVARHPAEPA